MTELIERLERLSSLSRDNAVITEIRDEIVRDLYAGGVKVSELTAITHLSRPRIYQILEGN